MKLDPKIAVMCNACEYEEEIGLTPLAGGGWDDRNVNRHLERGGWIVKSDDEHICDECRQKC